MQWTSAPNIGEAPLPQRARSFWKTRLNHGVEWLERLLEAERAQLPPWIVVGFGAGIAAWFAIPGPGGWSAFLFAALGLALVGVACGSNRIGRAIAWFAGAAVIGCGLIWARADSLAAPRLEWPRVVTFDGTVERVEYLTAKGSLRLTLAPRPSDLPRRVRVSIDEEKAPEELSEGSQVSVRARLAPPPPMALPGTYDFARDAWFKQIGAVGKAIGPVTVLSPATPQGLERAREDLRQHIGRRMPESTQGIAIALVTGDQNSVSAADAEAMRRSGLTHLLSVSGLHIAAVVAAVMFLTLKLLALSERLALRFNLTLLAAAAAAAAGIAYTLLTGAQVPTVRSCVAAILVLAGIALGRDALSLRLIASGAALVLLFRPESLAGASFQLSFAAVTAIVALHSSSWAKRWFERREEGVFLRILRAIASMTATGLVVELALIPLALFHFHRSGLYGVAANLIAIPLTTFVTMPMEAGALILDLAGLGEPLWEACSWSIDILLWIAHNVASSRGAVAALPSMPGWAFCAMAVGGLWIALWRSRLRLIGLVPVMLGALGAAMSPRPDLLVTGDGRHLAILDASGTPNLLRDRSGDYIRSLLSEAAGFDGEGGFLADSPFSRCSRDACIAEIDHGGRQWRVLATRSRDSIGWDELVRACASADIAVSDRRLPHGCEPKWLKLDRTTLRRSGGVAIYLDDEPFARTVAESVGDHPWRW